MQLLTHVQRTPDLDLDAALAGSLTTGLHGEVAAMNRENFIVRMHLEAVNRYRPRDYLVSDRRYRLRFDPATDHRGR